MARLADRHPRGRLVYPRVTMAYVDDPSRRYLPPNGGATERWMGRCGSCRSWWSVGEHELDPRCPCGGTITAVNMKAHVEALPQGKEPTIGGILIPDEKNEKKG